MLSATILAYQSRENIGKLNESHWLAFLVYFHSLFLLIRVVIQVLLVSAMIKSAMSTKNMAIMVALETIASMLVYFIPKFVTIKSKKAAQEIPAQTLHITKGGNIRYISGRKFPEGGIPKLIKKKITLRSSTISENTTTIFDAGPCLSTLSSTASILTSNNLSTEGLVIAGPTSFDILPARRVLFGGKMNTRTIAGTD